MKFKVRNKSHGEAIKKDIIKQENDDKCVNVSTIKSAYLNIMPEEEDYDLGWAIRSLRLERKVRVRETKEGWFLYFPEPEKLEPVKGLIEEEDKALIDYIINRYADLQDNRTKAMVHHKLKKDCIVERPCWFHKWTQNVVRKEDGTIVTQDLALCEFLEDGHIERIAWDHIRFVDEWE